MATAKKLDTKERGEICQEYRLARDKEEQINILAELYACSTAQIRGVLYDAGIYGIGPNDMLEAVEKIRAGITFGSLRNYKKSFSGIDAKSAKKIFKDYAYMPWGAETPEEAAAVKEQVKDALEHAKERAETKKKPEPVNPPLADPARTFSAEEIGILVNGLLSIQATDQALADQLKHEIDELHRKAAGLIDIAAHRMEDLKDTEARIAQGNELLQRLQDINAEEAAAATT